MANGIGWDRIGNAGLGGVCMGLVWLMGADMLGIDRLGWDCTGMAFFYLKKPFEN